MRKILFILLTTISFTFLYSCKGNNQTSKDNEALDTVWNDKVQDTFYGVRFSEPIQNIKSALNANGLLLDVLRSQDSPYDCYRTRYEELFDFGGIGWQFIFIDKGEFFSSITFAIPFPNKESAKTRFLKMIEYLKERYKFTDAKNSDSDKFQEMLMCGENGVVGHIYWAEVENPNQKPFYMVALTYEYGHQPSSINEL